MLSRTAIASWPISGESVTLKYADIVVDSYVSSAHVFNGVILTSDIVIDSEVADACRFVLGGLGIICDSAVEFFSSELDVDSASIQLNAESASMEYGAEFISEDLEVESASMVLLVIESNGLEK